MVPEGWELRSLQEVCEKQISYGIVQTGNDPNANVPCLRVVDLSKQKIAFDALLKTTEEVHRAYRKTILCEGELVLALRGEIGTVKLVSGDLVGMNITRGLARIAPKKSVVFSKFLEQQIRSSLFKAALFRKVGGSALQEISLGELRKVPVLLPPLPEQKKIAEILSTWDRAIEVAERQLENARLQKKALMQQLLTGTRRLPGFDGEWKTVKLGDVAGIIVSNVDKKTREGEVKVRLCNYMDVYSNDDINASDEFMKATASSQQIKKFAVKVGDVIITKDSEDPKDIAIPAYVASDSGDLVCGYHLAILRPLEQLDGRFLKYFIETPRSKHFFASRANGATRFGLTLPTIHEAEFSIPSKLEQKAISYVLKHCEKQLRQLQKKVSHLRTEKRALMQQLLTGKKRVKV
ncbi:type I restriction enzyme, S subunit [Cohaesibacter marisflavi]|uniref:Type I restriction enzyme, S subunit n=1 Tax=Cohaesibacter marisflavi TaxID=655353 RepID=A0A1I5JJ30_9HYPH|nr:restriction endonuclease subunit S [Cohaesibacter marisflavi]SFO72669.1 type I restriction enzyme, S subunit [Cohaesibacter marisflavi]